MKILRKIKFSDLVNKLYKIGEQSNLTEENIEFLLSVIEIDPQIDIISIAEIPSSMSPENMLRSLSIQILMKHTGTKYVEKIREYIQYSSDYSRLNSIVRAMTEKYNYV